jgi:hypothetical protein
VHLQIQNDDPPDKKFDGQPLELNTKEKNAVHYFTRFWGQLHRKFHGKGDVLEVTKLEDNYGRQTILDMLVDLK